MAHCDLHPRVAAHLAPVVALLATACGHTPVDGARPDAAGKPCNGLASSCGRTYDQVAIAATHNAFAYASGGPVTYVLPNQDLPIPDQLAAGIRGFGLRPCPYFGSDSTQTDRVYVTHNSDLRGILGTEPLDGILAEIKSFLDANPREIVTLYMESTVTPAQLASTFAAAGLGPYLFTFDPATGWPTLDAMIGSGQRLVAFNDSQDTSRPPWMMYLYDQIVDTDYNVLIPSQFKCAFYRGTAANPIYYFNQFLAVPLASTASTVNAAELIVAREHQCFVEVGRHASVVYVDMFREGDVVGAVEMLNVEYATGGGS